MRAVPQPRLGKNARSANYYATREPRGLNFRAAQWHGVCSLQGMTQFFLRFVGALALNPAAYEDIEADPRSTMQSVIVVLAVTCAGGFAAMGLGLIGAAGFLTGAIMMLGGWLLWVSLIATIGTTALAEPQTRSNPRELLRTLGYAAAPGVFVAFAAMRAAAPLVIGVVSIWMIAAAVVAARQALDYRSTWRAVGVCALSWALSVGVLIAIGLVFTQPVS